MRAAAARVRRWLRPLRPGWKAVASSAAPIVRSGSSIATGELPSTRASPRVGRNSPSRARIVVVLPAPLGPRKPVTRPASTAKERSSTATVLP